MPKHAAHEIDYRTVLIEVDGKLRGSQARRLGARLESFFEDGYDQVILDLRACGSLDSVGALVINGALERGQRIFVLIEPGLGGDDLIPPEFRGDPRLRVFLDSAEAIRHVRSREASGVLVS